MNNQSDKYPAHEYAKEYLDRIHGHRSDDDKAAWVRNGHLQTMHIEFQALLHRQQSDEIAIASLFDAIAHGDDKHKAWLKEAIEKHFNITIGAK